MITCSAEAAEGTLDVIALDSHPTESKFEKYIGMYLTADNMTCNASSEY